MSISYYSPTSGGWNSLENIIAGASIGMSEIGSEFFPAPQRAEVTHLPIEQMGGTGQTHRETSPEAQSMNDTFSYFMNDWVNTPYELQYATPAKVAESKQLSESVSVKKESAFDWINQGLEWALGTTKKISTIANQWDIATGKKVISTNTEGQSSGDAQPKTRNVSNVDTFIKRGADVIQNVGKAAENIFGQVKGLFNLGFDGDSQPVFSIQHELDPGTKLAIGSTGLILIVIFIVYILVKK